jgi:hypothetical protein
MSGNEGPKTTVDVDATGRGPRVHGAVGVDFPGTDESITIRVTVADTGDDEANKKAATGRATILAQRFVRDQGRR